MLAMSLWVWFAFFVELIPCVWGGRGGIAKLRGSEKSKISLFFHLAAFSRLCPHPPSSSHIPILTQSVVEQSTGYTVTSLNQALYPSDPALEITLKSFCIITQQTSFRYRKLALLQRPSVAVFLFVCLFS